ncbi:unnamed protein product [Caenorhabditis bovis]|uniref:PID domain-containing protein n=1 Tax=Caenorhabditis bovis TaxID=2654633 RepID=A0A8S1F227_9PELO|nr:unnamed protein product [Caenorhabditis bovis]
MSAFIDRCNLNSSNDEDDEEEEEEEEEDCTTVIKRAFSADCLPNELSSEELDDDDSDSDAEFLVHPCLRSIIKSKSAYAVRKDYLEAASIKPSKTSFEISLSKMMESTTKSMAVEAEFSVADLLPSLDEKWPDPDEDDDERKRKKRKKSAIIRYSPSVSENSELQFNNESTEFEHKRSSGCWSSPPNFFLEEEEVDRESPKNLQSWSAPDLFEEDSAVGQDAPQSVRIPAIRELQDLSNYSNSYPAIETPDNDPSICSYRLPSSAGSAPSPSPPRPLSPVFGKPAPASFRIPQSQSMNLPRRPDIVAFLSDVADINPLPPSFSIGSSVTSEDEEDDDEEDEGDSEWRRRRKDEEVWPEEGEARVCWTDTEGRVHRSATFQISRGHEDYLQRVLTSSRSAHSHLYNIVATTDAEEEADRIGDYRGNEMSAALAGSAHSQLDEAERKALATRQAWMERGSIVSLGRMSDRTDPYRNRLHPEVIDGGVHVNGIQSQYGSYSSLANAETSSSMSAMRRSCTTDEFRRTRRRLPRRPDEMSAPVEIPQSKSMYERAVFGNEPRDFTLRDQHRIDEDRVMVDAKIPKSPRPPSLALQSTIDTIIENNRQSMEPNLRAHDHQQLETPISPHAVLPSPGQSSSGRRLPPLPIHSAALLRRIPQNMSLPSGAPKPQDHTLCFMDGMADSMMDRSTIGLDDSYYEEDGINGNRKRKPGRKYDSSGVSSCTTSDSMAPTHRVQSAFHPRHSDELLLEIGDAVHVDRTADDHWSYGTNLRTGMTGIFPASVVCEIDLVEEICLGALPTNATKILNDDRDTFYLTMLASIEVAHHKGNDVLVQAMNKVLSMYKNSEEIIVPQTVLMEVSFRGIHVIDKRRKNFFQCPMFDFFYSLQNISFCGAHPKQLKYFGFITKHPLLPRFACHVFMSKNSTQPIVEAIGRAFKRSYDEYMAFAHPTEDIYLE